MMKDDFEYCLNLSPDVEIEELSLEKVILSSESTRLSWTEPSSALYHCVSKLIEGITKPDLCEEWTAKGTDSLPCFFYFLEKLKVKSFLCYSVKDSGQVLVQFVPYESDQENNFEPPDISEDIQLSRFAYLRNSEGNFVLESPLVSARVYINDPSCLQILTRLTNPKKVDAVLDQLTDISQKAGRSFLVLLQQFGFLSGGEEKKSLQTWEFHDLLFHARSRGGRHCNRSGQTFRFLGKMGPYPVLGNFSSKPMIALFKPDMKRLKEREISFTEVLEKRTSIRDHGEQWITAEQLGEFLYRSARIKEFGKSTHYDVSKRPSPGGGACHELELYPVIYQCQGIDSGLYHYHPEKHALDHCEVWNEQVHGIAENAMRATSKTELPQVLIVIAPRFGRVSWKYQSMAYSVILKNTGVLMQTMYLVATAMGLAPCSVGGGNADLFSKVVGTDYYEESSVGEFILGTKL